MQLDAYFINFGSIRCADNKDKNNIIINNNKPTKKKRIRRINKY